MSLKKKSIRTMRAEMTDNIIHLKFAEVLDLRDGLTVKKGNIRLKRGD